MLEKCDEIREKVKNCTKTEFDNEPVYNEKYLKSKIKSYKEKTNNFQRNRLAKVSQCICLSLILIDSVLRLDKNYYPQVF